jgi:hypothetical protein
VGLDRRHCGRRFDRDYPDRRLEQQQHHRQQRARGHPRQRNRADDAVVVAEHHGQRTKFGTKFRVKFNAKFGAQFIADRAAAGTVPSVVTWRLVRSVRVIPAP